MDGSARVEGPERPQGAVLAGSKADHGNVAGEETVTCQPVRGAPSFIIYFFSFFRFSYWLLEAEPVANGTSKKTPQEPMMARTDKSRLRGGGDTGVSGLQTRKRQHHLY
ncbi:hypothetical protein IMZ48_38810 [Candidatus Bathyarchaeota archaeon]|nr:hypothetical protein [Candidatus Bathyarchaeota archaeon]